MVLTVLVQFAGSTPEMVIIAAQKPVPEVGTTPRLDTQARLPLAWERLPADALLPAFSV
jgi:hypothetical protein